MKPTRTAIFVPEHMAEVLKAATGSFEHLSKVLSLSDVATVGQTITSMALTAIRKDKEARANEQRTAA